MTSERAGELAMRTTGLLVTVSVALALATLTWRLTGWNDGRASVHVAESLPSLGGTGGDVDVTRIVALAPFGGGLVSSGLPESALGLILKGVVMSVAPSGSRALISNGEAPAQSYGVGQAPAGNAVIEAIESHRVILRVGDQREALSFPRAAGLTVAGSPLPPSASSSAIAPPAATMSPETAAALASAAPVASAQPTPASPVPRAAPSPAASLSSLGVSASSQGYRVGRAPSAELRRFGLRPGDVVASLNGEPVGDVAGDRQLFERAVASGGARVEVIRDGRRVILSFPLR